MNYGNRRTKIRIYFGDHPPPHIHVERSGKKITRIALPSLLILTGPPLEPEDLRLILEQLDFLCDEYDRINPPKHT